MKTNCMLTVALMALAVGAAMPGWASELTALDIYDVQGIGNTPDSAVDLGDLGNGFSIQGLTIYEPGDVDYFTWTPKVNETLEIAVNFTHSRDHDLDMFLREGSYRTIGVSDTLTDNELITTPVVAGETYLLKILGYEDSTNQYDLSIGRLGQPPPSPGSGDGSGSSGGSDSGNQPPVPIPVSGSIANRLISLIDALDGFHLGRAREGDGRSDAWDGLQFGRGGECDVLAGLRGAVKQVHAGFDAKTVLRTLRSVVRRASVSRRSPYWEEAKFVVSSVKEIMNAIAPGSSRAGRMRAVRPEGTAGDGQTSVGYDVTSGEVWVDAPLGTELTSINIDSASGIFTGEAAQNLGGSFDNTAPDNIFKATFGSSFGSLSFGRVAQAGLSEEFLADDLTVVGSLAGGGELGDVDLIYVPEPSMLVLALLGLIGLLVCRWRTERKGA